MLINTKVTETVKRKISVGPKMRFPSLNSLKSALSAIMQKKKNFVVYFRHVKFRSEKSSWISKFNYGQIKFYNSLLLSKGLEPRYRFLF